MSWFQQAAKGRPETWAHEPTSARKGLRSSVVDGVRDRGLVKSSGVGGGEGGVLFGVELVQNVQHPAAECLGHRRAGEHGREVAATQGEYKAFYRERRVGVAGDFN